MFYPLYPIGIGAEWWLMYQSVEPVGKVSPVLPPVFYFLLALYVPGKQYANTEVLTLVDMVTRRVYHAHIHGQAKEEDTRKI